MGYYYNFELNGFTTQEGTGDASPNNVREIENAGSKLVEKILTGTEAWVLRGMSQGISSEYIRYSIGESGDREAYGVCYCDRYKYFKSVSAYTAQNGVGLYGSESAPFDVILKKAEYPTVDVWKQKLKDLYAAGDPIKYYYTPKSGIHTTGIYMGIEVEQGENYHCEIVELQALLHEGDTLETNVSHEGAQKCVETHAKATYVFTGKESFSREDGWVDGAVRIGGAIPDAVKVNDYGTVANLKCSHLKTVSASEVVSLGLVGCSQGGGLNLYFYFGSTYNTTDLAKAYIAEQYAAGTPITIEYELAQPKVFVNEAIEPVYIKALQSHSFSSEEGTNLAYTRTSKFIDPKTNWRDLEFFNLDPDYSRIKADIEVIKEYTDSLYPDVSITNMPKEYSISDDIYSEVPNNIVKSIEQIRSGSITPDGYAQMSTYIDGQPAWNANELNAIENNVRLLYNMFVRQEEALQKLPIMLGIRGIT